MSEGQKEKLRQAQLNYVANDPRWEEHRQKLADAQQRPEQKAILSERTKAYIESDPRWPEHQARLLEANGTSMMRFTLLPEEVELLKTERAKGRTLSYLAEAFSISVDVLSREAKENGISTAAVQSDRRASRTKGFWRSFDPA